MLPGRTWFLHKITSATATMRFGFAIAIESANYLERVGSQVVLSERREVSAAVNALNSAMISGHQALCPENDRL
jgi:hypothetical protein